MKNWLTSFFSKMKSRKFIVEVVATIALFTGHITGKEWIVVSSIYIGGNVLKWGVDILKSKKGL